jgi:hypothetical protein
MESFRSSVHITVVKAVALYVNSFCSTVASEAPSSLDYPLV